MSASGTHVEELLATLRARRRRLPFEIGAFLALQVVEATLDRPRNAVPRTILVREDGKVELVDAEACDERTAIRAIHGVLTALLAAAGEGVPSMLLELLEQPLESESITLARFRDELEASLVPLNRSAAERVLARTLRDLRREGAKDPRRSGSDDDADADLDALLEGREAPVREAPVVIAPPSDEARPSTRPPSPADRDGPKRSIFKDDVAHGLAGLEERPARSARPIGTYVALVALLLAGVGALIYASRDGRPAEARRTPAPEPAPRAPVVERGEIVLELTTEGSVARLLVGRVPTVVDDVPVGVSQELVAVADDGSVARLTVPADSAYAERDGLPEQVVTLPAATETGDAALAITALRADAMGRPTGARARLRVSEGPAGARVYRTIGFPPLVRIEGWPVSRVAEILVSAPGHASETIRVEAANYTVENGVRRASYRVTLDGPAGP